MPPSQSLNEIKTDLKAIIRQNSDRGFLPYGGCNRVCLAMSNMVEGSRALGDRQETLDVHLYILLEAVKLISHADTSSGMVTDVIHDCLAGVEELAKSAPDERKKPILDAIVKTAKNKAFQEWAEFAFEMLRSTVHLVRDHKQAETVYALFPILGKTYSGEEYPDRYVITQGMIEKLDGAEAADRYRMENLHIPEIRTLAVEQALSSEQFAVAEKLCLEALKNDKTYGEPSEWAYYLERIYRQIGDKEKRIKIVRQILKKGDRSFYPKLKELYESDGVWQQKRESVLEELSKEYMSHKYAALLSEEGELARLLEVIQASHYLIEHFGKQLAREFPAETFEIYEKYILKEAADATDRRKYKGVCKLIKGYYDSGAKVEAQGMIRLLAEKYPRRAALLDELEALGKKLKK